MSRATLRQMFVMDGIVTADELEHRDRGGARRRDRRRARCPCSSCRR